MYSSNDDLPRPESCDFSSDRAVLIKGDCLDKMSLIPSRSVKLVLTDPPYHSTKKANVRGDTDFETDEDYLSWMRNVSEEWSRVLKLSGSVFCFCSSDMEPSLVSMFSERFVILSRVVWTKPNEPGFDGWRNKVDKDSLRRWYPQSERAILMGLRDGSTKSGVPSAGYIRQKRLEAGLTMHDLAESIGGYGKVNHGGIISNWESGRSVPSKEQYERMRSYLLGDGMVGSMLGYDDVVRTFHHPGHGPYTDVWDFKTVRQYRGRHPAEKPLDMLRHVIETVTNPDDIVLDCFAGSGSTALASLGLGRRSISIEVDDRWADHIEMVLSRFMASSSAVREEPMTVGEFLSGGNQHGLVAETCQ